MATAISGIIVADEKTITITEIFGILIAKKIL
jgi:hypothetical protein